MATGMQSLPTNSPVPYSQPIERGYMSEGSQEGVYATPYVDSSEHTDIVHSSQREQVSLPNEALQP